MKITLPERIEKMRRVIYLVISPHEGSCEKTVIAPKTPIGRLCGAIIMLAGVAAVAVPTAIINSGFVKRNLTPEEFKRILSEEDRRQNVVLERQRLKIEMLEADANAKLAEIKKILTETRDLVRQMDQQKLQVDCPAKSQARKDNPFKTTVKSVMARLSHRKES